MGEKKKLNWWEFKKCGRELEGANVSEFGVCPAAKEHKAHGIHHGKNGGRCCWVIAGTLCKGKIQGTFAKKFGNCQKYDFYALVKKEEYPKFKLIMSISKEIQEKNI